MIRLPLDHYTHSSAPELTIDVDEDPEGGGRVFLSVNLELAECLPTSKIKSSEDFEPVFVALALDGSLEGDALKVAELKDALEDARLRIAAQKEEVAYLRELVEKAGELRAIDRELSPSDARALAAMLEHYATEAELS